MRCEKAAAQRVLQRHEPQTWRPGQVVGAQLRHHQLRGPGTPRLDRPPRDVLTTSVAPGTEVAKPDAHYPLVISSIPSSVPALFCPLPEREFMLKSFSLSAALLAISYSAFGQTTTGTIQGRVADATGSLVPSAKVTITNQATGVQQMLVTNSEGGFVQPYVLPGDYTVSVEKEGFEKYVTTGVKLNVQQTVALEIALKVGNHYCPS